MPTKLEIFAAEQSNEGKIFLYPEGMFFKAYERSAFLLCTKIHAFKVSSRLFNGLDEPLVSVGFPFSSLEKFSEGMKMESCGDGVTTLLFPESTVDVSGFKRWKSSYFVDNNKNIRGLGTSCSSVGYNAYPIYNSTYRFVSDLCIHCSKIPRDYKYSVGEETRLAGMRILICVCEAIKSARPTERLIYLKEAREKMTEVQLCLRFLADIHILSNKRYAGFVDITEDISNQLYKWEKSEKISKPD